MEIHLPAPSCSRSCNPGFAVLTDSNPPWKGKIETIGTEEPGEAKKDR
jgi:hypothetical protein